MLPSFLRDRRGGMAVTAALMILPTIGMAGAAVDYSRATAARERVQVLIDGAAVNAVSRESRLTRATLAREMVEGGKAELPEGVTITEIRAEEVEVPDGPPRLRVTVHGTVETAFARLVGVGTVGFSVETQAVASDKHYEIALVVDVTGSMKGQKIDALRQSARAFVETLLSSEGAAERIRIGIVPYSAAVNIGPDRLAWLDRDPLAGATGLTALSAADGFEAVVENRYVFDASEVSKQHCKGTNTTFDDALDLCYIGELSVFEGEGECPGVAREDVCWVAQAWAGCVLERYRTDHELTAAPPTVAPFRPYFWPSWRGLGGGSANHNSYLPGPLDESGTTNATGNNGRGPNLGCPKNELVFLSNDRDMLLDQIADFDSWHRGGTMGHIGMLWGWRMLSPEWRGLWNDDAAPHDDGERPLDADAKVEKIVVFMTDGENGFFTGMAPSNDSDYTAYGRLSDTDGFTRSNNRQRLDDRMQAVCAEMRAEGIEIFAVGFQLGSASARSLLRGCASSETHDFTSDVSTLVEHFERIAHDITERRIAIVR